MRVRLDKYQAEHASTQWKSWLMIAIGSIVAVGSSFVLLLGVLIVLSPDGSKEKGDNPEFANDAGIFLMVIGAIPLLVGALLIWRGVARRLRFAKIRDLAAFARVQPLFHRDDMARALSLNAVEAERLFLDAVTLQIVVAGPEDFVPHLPPPTLPSYDPGTAATVASPRPAPAASTGAPSVTPVSLGPGTLLGGTYRIESVLGSGGMGRVFAASHTRTGRKYAVKTILPDASLSPDMIRRFEREALAASALGHPNIVAVHDFNHEGDLHYLVMDLLEGETLEQRLAREGSLDWATAQKLSLEIASALAAAHDAGLLHRDVKPANVFLAAPKGAPERAILLDFGLVKSVGDGVVSRITETGAAVGTPMYMSPEQARGDAVDVRSDVYSLGALVYEMVTGAPPFIDRTLAAIYARILTEPVAPASKVATRKLPPALDGVLNRALAKDPTMRYGSARALSAALVELGEHVPTTLRIA